jgi:O-antigen/teichoic acid export membrane protein
MWYLLKVSDNETVGTFHGVRLITQFIHIGAVMLTTIVAAHVTRAWEDKGREAAAARLGLLTKAGVVVFVLGATAMSLLRPLALWMFPEAFAAGRVAYNPLVLFFLLVGLVGLVAVRFNLLEKPRLACLAWLAGAVVNVLASYVLLPPGHAATLSSTAALQAVAWAGVIGASATLGACVLLVSLQGLRLDRASLVMICAAFALAGGWLGGLLASMALIALLLTTRLLLSTAERAEFAASVLRTSDR